MAVERKRFRANGLLTKGESPATLSCPDQVMATMSGPESTAWGLGVAARESTTGDGLDAPTWDLDLVEAALRLIQRKWTLRVINALWVDDLRYHHLEHRLRIRRRC